MARVLGIGGVFFKSRDPQRLASWYAEWLGLAIDPSFGGKAFHPKGLPAEDRTLWSPFQESTTYFEPSSQSWMINLIVDDLPGALRQVEQGGATLVGDPEESEFGAFGWFLDPDGNKVELWVPPS